VADFELPKTWREAVPYVVWGVLVLGFGLELTTAIVRGEWLRAIISFCAMLGVAAVTLHWPQLRSWAMAMSPNWVVGAFGCLLLVIALSPFVEEKRWPFSTWFASPSSDQQAADLATVTQERDQARQQLADAQARVQTLETRANTSRPQPSSVPNDEGPITWINDLSTWTGGTDEQGRSRLLGIAIRGRTKSDIPPVELSSAYIVSNITGEKKVLQVGIAPGPKLTTISDINQIPPNVLLELWATFPAPGITFTDFETRWGAFYFHAEYAGLKFDKNFDRQFIDTWLSQYPGIGPHVTTKAQDK
jgi:hypothetical protein